MSIVDENVNIGDDKSTDGVNTVAVQIKLLQKSKDLLKDIKDVLVQIRDKP